MERRVVFEVADVAMVLDFVQHGLAVAIVPPSIVDAPFTQIRLVAIKRHSPFFVTSIATPTHRELGARPVRCCTLPDGWRLVDSAVIAQSRRPTPCVAG
jgi:DNA-binding transcriptional LysR family regulator